MCDKKFFFKTITSKRNLSSVATFFWLLVMAEPELFRLYIRKRPNENLNFTIEPNFSFSEDLIELGIKKFDLLVKIDGECFFLISITYLKYIPSMYVFAILPFR